MASRKNSATQNESNIHVAKQSYATVVAVANKGEPTKKTRGTSGGGNKKSTRSKAAAPKRQGRRKRTGRARTEKNTEATPSSSDTSST